MPVIVVAFLVGIVSGLRTFTPVAAISWAARLGWLPLGGTKFGFLGHAATPYVTTAIALGEMVADTLPSTPSRTVPVQFGARVASGGFGGAAVGASAGQSVAGLIAGMAGSVLGTLAGAKERAATAKAFDGDLPAALLEDAVAVVVGLLAVSRGTV